MGDPGVLRTASFDPKVKAYWLISGTVVCAVTVVGIPLIPVYLILGHFLLNAYLKRLSCVLTPRSLEIKKGILSRTESTVPLEKITDLQMFQGPIMRAMGLHGFRVETAGQSSGATGYLLNMIGIEDTEGFRTAVLSQRDSLSEGGGRVAPPAPAHDDSVLVEIRDALLRIEQSLGDRSG